MKINGNDSGAHAAKKPSRERTAPKKQKTARRRMGRAARMATVIVCCVLALACAVAAWYMLWEKPPERPTTGLNTLPPATEKPAATAAPSATPEPTEDPNAGAPASLNENMYTFLVVGLDKVAYHTDTIMVGRFDVETHEINVVSIPRDTLMNITGSTKKINELYLRGVNSGEGGVTRLLAGIKDMIGFDVDVYAVVDLQAFVELVNAVGGVDYDVPVDMHYYDPTQDLVIDLDAGMQHLTGEQAIGVMRFRSGYASADIGRIGTQQDFLMSVASQFLSLGSIPRLGEFIDIFNEYVETNMTAENLAFFARQFLMCSSEDIHFYTMPGNYADSIRGVSYVSVYVNDWLEMINSYLNPYDAPVTASNVNLLSHSSSGFYATAGYVAGGEDSFIDLRPSPSPSPSPEPTESVPPDGGDPDASASPGGDGDTAESAPPAESTGPAAESPGDEWDVEATQPVEPSEDPGYVFVDEEAGS